MCRWFDPTFRQLKSEYLNKYYFSISIMNINSVNLLINLKNYSLLKKESLLIKYTNESFSIIKILYTEGFIQSFKLKKKNSIVYISIVLRQFYNKSIFNDLKLISNSQFLSTKDIYKISDKKKILFISTNKGILSLSACKKYKIGGRALFYC